MSDVRSMNDDAKFDADVKFDDKGTSKRFTTEGGSQEVNASDEVADEASMGNTVLVRVNQGERGRCKQVRKPTQKGLGYQISLAEETRRKLKSKMDLLYSAKNQITIEESMIQFNDLFKMFESAQNQYMQLKEEQDGADTWFEDIDNWVFEFKHKIYNWLREAERESAMSARRSNQSGKSRSSHCSKNSYSSSYSEKSRSIKAREIEEKAKVAELQAKIQFLEQRQRAENPAEALKVPEEMAVAKKQEWRFTRVMMKSILKKVQSHHQ